MTKNIIMSYITKLSNFVGPTFVVTLCKLDQDRSTVSFALTKDNQQILFINFVSPPLIHQTCESYNVFVKFPKGVCKKII